MIWSLTFALMLILINKYKNGHFLVYIIIFDQLNLWIIFVNRTVGAHSKYQSNNNFANIPHLVSTMSKHFFYNLMANIILKNQ